MKKIIATLISVIVFYSTNAQKLRINYSDELPKTKIQNQINSFGNKFYSIEESWIGQMFNTYYNTKFHSIEFTTYDQQLQIIKTDFIETKEKEFGPYRSKFFEFKKSLFLLYSKADKEKNITIYLSKFNTETFKLEDTKVLFNFSFNMYNQFNGLNSPTLIDKLKFDIIENDNCTRILLAAGGPTLIHTCFLESNFDITQKTSTSIPKNFEDFVINRFFFDKQGNKYCSYQYYQDKHTRSGFFVQDKNGKEIFEKFSIGIEGLSSDLFFGSSKDSNKIYIVSNYKSNLKYSTEYEGIILSSINTNTFKQNAAELIPYPDSIAYSLYKAGIGIRNKSDITIYKIDYNLVELNDETICLYGFSKYSNSSISWGMTNYLYSQNKWVTTKKQDNYYGPIVQLTKNKYTNSFGCITSSNNIECSYVIPIILSDKIIYVHNQKKEDLEYLNLDKKTFKELNNLVLIAQTVNKEGKLINTEILSDNSKEDYIHSIQSATKLDCKNKYFIPLKDGNRVYKTAILEAK